jgi:hypothetical protein
MKNTLSNEQIANRLIKINSLENDNQLAIHLGVERQQIRQFRNGQRIGLTQLIMTDLLSKLDVIEQ